jgi:WD40 repeat protein
MIASGSSDKQIKIWDAITGGLLNALEGHSDWVMSLAWNHDGSRIVSGSGDIIKIWNAVTGLVVNCMGGHSRYV